MLNIKCVHNCFMNMNTIFFFNPVQWINLKLIMVLRDTLFYNNKLIYYAKSLGFKLDFNEE